MGDKPYPVLMCGGECKRVTPHVLAFRVPGELEVVSAGYAGPQHKLTEPQEVVPCAARDAKVVELVYLCLECGALRRWGLEVPGDEVRGVRGASGGAGESGSAANAELLARKSVVPEETVEARAARLEHGTGEGAGT